MDGATVSFLFLQFRNKTKKPTVPNNNTTFEIETSRRQKNPNIIQKIDLCQPFVVACYTSDSVSQSTVMVI